ncbi:MAG: radical SAM protein [Patescibacteria group bacterium]
MKNKVEKNIKKVVLICFYDKVGVAMKTLSASLLKAGHIPYIIFLKEDSARITNGYNKKALQYQMLWLDQFWGSGIDVEPITEKEWELFRSLMKKINPDVVGISSRSAHRKLFNRVVDETLAITPKARLIAGGYGPILKPKWFLEKCKYICLGEGDKTMVDFTEAKNPKKIFNIGYLENGKLKFNQMLPPEDINKLPYIDFTEKNKYLIENNKIQTNAFYDRRAYDIFCTRGCPSSCTYCMACQWDTMLKPYKINFPKIRIRTPQSIINELLYVKKKYNINYVRFKDDIFGLNEKWLMEMMDLYDKEIGLKFSCFLDERYATENIVKRLYKSGLRKTTVGIQSASEEVRKTIFGRQISNERTIAYAKMLQSNDIEVKYHLIGWNPFENHKTLKDGVEFLRKMPKSSDVSVFEMKIFPNSLVEKLYKKKNPVALATDEYTSWAFLQQMVLFSKSMESKALKFINESNYDLDKIFKIFKKGISGRASKFKLVASNDIEVGGRIMDERIHLKETNEAGITSGEMDKLMGMVTTKLIKKGELFQWDKVKSTYARIRTG